MGNNNSVIYPLPRPGALPERSFNTRCKKGEVEEQGGRKLRLGIDTQASSEKAVARFLRKV